MAVVCFPHLFFFFEPELALKSQIPQRSECHRFIEVTLYNYLGYVPVKGAKFPQTLKHRFKFRDGFFLHI